ncbi:hypothetical protein BC937DRAFT_88025 [Endogone sp. FLAS-F59071]|nr:hypothetical protein BC937DRAFT_88025 [Endogone sp. FLAS-F59071]|eukprot:RUS19068.1 hypothetical protein BC937DRAFT_88025 [Endogone sp. FLAS-F59071]
MLAVHTTVQIYLVYCIGLQYISPHQLVLSHSPMKALVPLYENTPVLVVGGTDYSCREVAERYGFRRVIQPDDILSWEPAIWPFHSLSTAEQTEAKVTKDFLRQLCREVRSILSIQQLLFSPTSL